MIEENTDKEFLEKHKNKVSECAFYCKRGPGRWLDDHTATPILVRGHMPEHIPSLTVVIMTYKRPILLKRALESALNQMGYDDYIVAIADNEGAPSDKITQTQLLIENIDDDRILYYRYDKSVNNKMNSAASLVQTEWFMILHDDDYLNVNCLRIMMPVIKNERIDMLCCRHANFSNQNNEGINGFITKPISNSNLCRRVGFDETIFIHKNEVTGAIIRTDSFTSLGGGHDDVSLGCGDVVFASEFNYYYERYYVETELYGVSYHENNLSADSRGFYKGIISKYYWFGSALRIKWGNRYRYLQSALVRAYLYKMIEDYNEGYRDLFGDEWRIESEVITDCLGIPGAYENGFIIRRLYKTLVRLWDNHIRKVQLKESNKGTYSCCS